MNLLKKINDAIFEWRFKRAVIKTLKMPNAIDKIKKETNALRITLADLNPDIDL